MILIEQRTSVYLLILVHIIVGQVASTDREGNRTYGFYWIIFVTGR